MMVSVGLGEFGVEASISHLMTHASFKAGLFLAAGVVIMSSGGYQTQQSHNYSHSLKSDIKSFNGRAFFTYKFKVQTILLNNINSMRCYTTSIINDGLNNVKDLLPTNYVERFDNLTSIVRYNIKQKYKQTAVIYLWFNKTNGRCYVGKTINLKSRLENYMDSHYLKKVQRTMPISGAILKYGILNFELFILEVIPSESIHELSHREFHWYHVLKPSYNVNLDFLSQTSTQFGRQVSLEARQQASAAMKGRIITPEWRQKISDSLKGRPVSEAGRIQLYESSTSRKTIYCYDFDSNKLLFVYVGIQFMARTAEFPISVKTIQRKLDKNEEHFCNVKGQSYKWSIPFI